VADEIIIKTKSGDLIPAIKADAFGLAVQELEKLNEQMTVLEDRAKALPKIFESKAQYDLAAEIIVSKKSIVTLVDAQMAPFEEQIKRVKNFINQQKLIVTNHGEQIKGILTPGMADWDQREKAATAAEEQRLQKEREAKLKRENEEKAQKDAAAAAERKKERIDQIRNDLKDRKITKRVAEKLLREAGADEEAEKAKIAADKDDADKEAAEKASKLKVKPQTGPTAGITRRVNYTASCTDQANYIKITMEAYKKGDMDTYNRLVQMLEVSDQKLGQKARELKSDDLMMTLFPFTEASHAYTF